MADLMKLAYSNWSLYTKEVQSDFIMSNFNRQQRRKYTKDGNLKDLFKFYI